MWELTKFFCDIERLFEIPEDTFLFYYELKRHINPNMSDDILLVFHNDIALRQCYYRARVLADESVYSDNIKKISINGINYEFEIIDNIYKTNKLNERYFADIQFKNAYDKII